MFIKARRASLVILVTSVMIFIGGCATIATGRNESVTFQSTPAGASVAINGATIGTTPLTTMIPKKSGQTLTISKPGYKTFTTTMTTTVNGWFFGNIALGGLIGSTTDAATGSMYEYSPQQYMVTLEVDGASNAETNTVGKSKQDKVREFIVLSYNPLISDISKGTGNYLSTLFTMLDIQPKDRTSALKRIKALSEAFPDIAQFADQVSAAYVKDKAASHS